ncbi:MAG TPA: type IV pilus secretin PilQ [Terriglobia bacterium]|nr:type IV pilus secretin PilQ [Terriglobia bacterium]
MRRIATNLLKVTWLMVGIVPIFVGSIWAAPEPATLKAVTLSARPTGTELLFRVDGTYTYKAVQVSPDTLFIDLAGVRAEGVARSQQWVNPEFSGYKLLSYKDASGAPVVRIQLEMKQAQPFVVRKDGANLELQTGTELSASAPAAPAPAPVAVPAEPSAPASPATSSGPLLVSNVMLDKHESGETNVDISTTRNVGFRVAVLPNPPRLVVDLDGARLTALPKNYPADTEVLKAVRIGQFHVGDPDVVRVVADMNGNPSFDVHATPTGVRIELRPRGGVKADALASKAESPAAPSVASRTAPVAPVAPNSAATPKVTVPATHAEVAYQKPAVPPAPVATPKVTVATPPAETAYQKAVVAPTPVATPKVTTPAPPVVEQANAKPATVPAPVTASSANTADPSAAVAERTHVVTPPARIEPQEAVKADVQSTLPPPAPSQQAVAAPLPPPASATPQALRAERAAQTLGLGKEAAPEAAQNPPPANPPAAPTTEEAKLAYTGEPISLNLKDVDLKDFFRLIHEISGLNIIIDPNVTGSVTLVLDSVPWDQALDIVLKDNRLGKVLEGNVLRIARVETLTSEQDAVTKLADARIAAAPLVTVFQPLNYAKAADVAALLKTWAGGGALSRRGTVLVDVRDNTLVISDVQTQIPIIQSVLAKLDKKAKQVSIEARVVLANADFSRTLSVALSGTTRGSNPNGPTMVGGSTGVGSSVTPTNSIPSTTSPFSSLTIPQNTTTGFGAIAITNASAKYVINAVITAQEERDQAKTISRPTIVTQNNVQGMVQQGVQVPIQTSINNTVTIQYYNATLQLTVTPQVTEENNIFLIIHVLNNTVGAALTNAGPSINTQEATTSVLVPDGGTVVFGGITVTSRTKSATYVPWVGSIPVIGHLFKTSNVQDQDQELLFFVSPKVLET